MKFWAETRGSSFEERDSGQNLWLRRQVLVMRMMLEAATEEKLREVCEKLMEKAAAGSLGATQLVFRLLMGKRSTQLEQLVAAEACEQACVAASGSKGGEEEREERKVVLEAEEPSKCEDSAAVDGSVAGDGVEGDPTEANGGLCTDVCPSSSGSARRDLAEVVGSMRQMAGLAGGQGSGLYGARGARVGRLRSG